jgi:hypothetical protein
VPPKQRNVRKKNEESKGMKSGRYKLQIKRERYKGEINYTAFPNYEAVNKLIAIQCL